MGLTKKQNDFCAEYVKSRNAQQSALEAGYSSLYAEKRAYLLLQHKDVAERILELEKTYFDNIFKKLSFEALIQLEDVLKDSKNRYAQLNSIKMIFQLAKITDRHGEPEKIETETIFSLLIPSEYQEFMNNKELC